MIGEHACDWDSKYHGSIACVRTVFKQGPVFSKKRANRTICRKGIHHCMKCVSRLLELRQEFAYEFSAQGYRCFVNLLEPGEGSQLKTLQTDEYSAMSHVTRT